MEGLSFLLVASALVSHAAGQALPVGTSTVGGVAEYMGTAVATAPLGMPTLAWNCAKMPAICENVNARNSLSSQGDGYGSLNGGPIELHYDINKDNRNAQRGQTACPSGWSSRNCIPGAGFSGSQIVCADGDSLAGSCFPGELWQRTDGSSQCLRTPFISYPGGEAPTALMWSCDEWPPKSTVEGGAGANTACAPLGVTVIGSNVLPAAVLAAENQIYTRSEQNYQGNAQNALRQYVSGQNPPLLGIWAFEFDTFYDDDAGSYATRVTYPNAGGSSGTTGFVSRSENITYRSEYQWLNGSIDVHSHRENSFDRRGRLIPRQEPAMVTVLCANSTSNATAAVSSATLVGTAAVPPQCSIIRGSSTPTAYQPAATTSSGQTAAGAPASSAATPGSPGASAASAVGSIGGIMSSIRSNATTSAGIFPIPTTASQPTIQSSDNPAASVTTITASEVSTTLVDASTVTANTTLTTTGPDGTPTSGIELVDCDVCGAEALLIFGLPLAAAAAAPVYVIPGVGLVPVAPGGAPLDASDASQATAQPDPTSTGSGLSSSTVSSTSASASASDGPDSCELYIFDSLGGDGEPEDDSYTEPSETTTSTTALQTTTSLSPTTTSAAPTTDEAPPPQETICSQSGGQADCIQDSDCTCPDIPNCELVPKCQQQSAARFLCWCYFPGSPGLGR